MQQDNAAKSALPCRVASAKMGRQYEKKHPMSNRANLRDVVNTTWLRARAGKRNFDYGGAYFHSNTVHLTRTSDGLVEGTIDDSPACSTRLWSEGDTVHYACSCREGQQSQFCKHLVALGLTWLEQRKTEPGSSFAGYPAFQLLERYLHSLPREALVDLLIAQSERDATLRRHLQGLAARHVGQQTTPLQESVLKIISRLRPGTPPQRLATDIKDLAAILEDTCSAGHSHLACDLGERALERAAFVARTQTDAAGHLTASLEMLREVRTRACSQTVRSGARGATPNKFA